MERTAAKTRAPQTQDMLTISIHTSYAYELGVAKEPNNGLHARVGYDKYWCTYIRLLSSPSLACAWASEQVIARKPTVSTDFSTNMCCVVVRVDRPMWLGSACPVQQMEIPRRHCLSGRCLKLTDSTTKAQNSSSASPRRKPFCYLQSIPAPQSLYINKLDLPRDVG